jgi:hypothetical protein
MGRNKSAEQLDQLRDEILNEKLEDAQLITEIELGRMSRIDDLAIQKAANNREMSENVQRLLRKMKPIDVTLPERRAELWEYAINELNLAVSHTAKAGFALLMLKEMTPHGEFLEELQAREIPQSTAKDAMSTARFLLKVPGKIGEQFAHLAGSKLIELARIPDETFEDIMNTEQIDGNPLDKLDRMSVRELKATVRKLKDRHAKELELKKKDLERKDKEIVKLSSTIDELKATELPPDEAEVAALAKLSKIEFQFDLLIGSIMAARFDNASARVMVRAFHLCEYMEYSSRFEATKIRHTNGQMWQDAWANENEVAQSQKEMEDKYDALLKHSGKEGLS